MNDERSVLLAEVHKAQAESAEHIRAQSVYVDELRAETAALRQDFAFIQNGFQSAADERARVAAEVSAISKDVMLMRERQRVIVLVAALPMAFMSLTGFFVMLRIALSVLDSVFATVARAQLAGLF